MRERVNPWAVSALTIALCIVAFVRSPSSLMVPLGIAVAQAVLAPLAWLYARRRLSIWSIPATIVVTHAVLWIALVIYARSLADVRPDGVRVRGEGLAIWLAVHPFVAVALALLSLGFAAVAAFVVKPRG